MDYDYGHIVQFHVHRTPSRLMSDALWCYIQGGVARGVPNSLPLNRYQLPTHSILLPSTDVDVHVNVVLLHVDVGQQRDHINSACRLRSENVNRNK